MKICWLVYTNMNSSGLYITEHDRQAMAPYQAVNKSCLFSIYTQQLFDVKDFIRNALRDQ